MPWTPPPFDEARAASAAGELPDGIFARALVAHPTWWVPCDAATAAGEAFVVRTVRTADQGEWLPVFSSERAWEAYAAADDTPDLGPHHLVMPGELLVGHLDDRLAGLDLDPVGDDPRHYPASAFADLRALRTALPVELLLAGHEVPDGWDHLLAHPDYTMLGTPEALLLAPDDQGRRLAAVCTAPDTLAAWLAEVQAAGHEEVGIVRLSGRDLFSQLAPLPLEGVVFNPSGPLPPRAVALALAQQAVQHAEAHPPG